MRVQFVQKDNGGILAHYMVDVPHDGSRWSSTPAPSVTLYDSGGGELVASTLASTGPSTRVSSGVSSGAAAIPLTSASGFERFEEYKIGPNNKGQWEWFTVDAVSTGGLGILGTLKNAYEVSTLVQSHRLSYRVSSGVLDTVARNCRAEWRYTAKGPPPAVAPIVREDSSIFHVAYYAPRYNLTESEVLQELPYARQLIDNDQRIDLIMRRLWERRVLPDIARMMEPGALVSGEQADELLLIAFQRWAILRKPGEAANERAEMLAAEYSQALESLRDTLVDLDESGGTDETETPRGPSTPRILRG